MTLKRCLSCNGSGRIMGGGMMIKDCDECDGSGKLFQSDNHSNLKEFDGYKSAVKRLKSKNPELSDAEAEKLLADAFEKEKPKRGRPKNERNH